VAAAALLIASLIAFQRLVSQFTSSKPGDSGDHYELGTK
jgi:hypothetical protein